MQPRSPSGGPSASQSYTAPHPETVDDELWSWFHQFLSEVKSIQRVAKSSTSASASKLASASAAARTTNNIHTYGSSSDDAYTGLGKFHQQAHTTNNANPLGSSTITNPNSANTTTVKAGGGGYALGRAAPHWGDAAPPPTPDFKKQHQQHHHRRGGERAGGTCSSFHHIDDSHPLSPPSNACDSSTTSQGFIFTPGLGYDDLVEFGKIDAEASVDQNSPYLRSSMPRSILADPVKMSPIRQPQASIVLPHSILLPAANLDCGGVMMTPKHNNNNGSGTNYPTTTNGFKSSGSNASTFERGLGSMESKLMASSITSRVLQRAHRPRAPADSCGTFSSRMAARQVSRLAKSIRSMKPSDLHDHMEKAVRLLFHLIKERNLHRRKNTQHHQQRKDNSKRGDDDVLSSSFHKGGDGGGEFRGREQQQCFPAPQQGYIATTFPHTPSPQQLEKETPIFHGQQQQEDVLSNSTLGTFESHQEVLVGENINTATIYDSGDESCSSSTTSSKARNSSSTSSFSSEGYHRSTSYIAPRRLPSKRFIKEHRTGGGGGNSGMRRGGGSLIQSSTTTTITSPPRSQSNSLRHGEGGRLLLSQEEDEGDAALLTFCRHPTNSMPPVTVEVHGGAATTAGGVVEDEGNHNGDDNGDENEPPVLSNGTCGNNNNIRRLSGGEIVSSSSSYNHQVAVPPTSSTGGAILLSPSSSATPTTTPTPSYPRQQQQGECYFYNSNSNNNPINLQMAKMARFPQITDSMDFDDLMGSDSLSESTDFIQHLAVEKERDQNGNRILNGYVFCGQLGAGAYGKVRLAYERGNPLRKFAIKIVPRSLSMSVGRRKDAFKREVAIMKEIRHKNIVSLHAVVDDPEAAKVYLIMDYIEGGNLLEDETCPQRKAEGYLYKPLPEAAVVRYLKQLIDGLRYLHKHDIAHRDIKPTNVLLRHQDNRVFITDFGVSELGNHNANVDDLNMTFSAAVEESVQRDLTPPGSPDASQMLKQVTVPPTTKPHHCVSFPTEVDEEDNIAYSSPSASPTHPDNTRRHSMVVCGHKGTPMFWSPEMFRASTREYFVDGESQDTWALGVTLFMMLVGKSPFTSSRFMDLKKEIGGTEEVNVPDCISSSAQDLLRRMLCKDSFQRPSLVEVRQSEFLGDMRSRTRGCWSPSSSPSSVSSPITRGPGTRFFSSTGEGGGGAILVGSGTWNSTSHENAQSGNNMNPSPDHDQHIHDEARDYSTTSGNNNIHPTTSTAASPALQLLLSHNARYHVQSYVGYVRDAIRTRNRQRKVIIKNSSDQNRGSIISENDDRDDGQNDPTALPCSLHGNYTLRLSDAFLSSAGSSAVLSPTLKPFPAAAVGGVALHRRVQQEVGRARATTSSPTHGRKAPPPSQLRSITSAQPSSSGLSFSSTAHVPYVERLRQATSLESSSLTQQHPSATLVRQASILLNSSHPQGGGTSSTSFGRPRGGVYAESRSNLGTTGTRSSQNASSVYGQLSHQPSSSFPLSTPTSFIRRSTAPSTTTSAHSRGTTLSPRVNSPGTAATGGGV